MGILIRNGIRARFNELIRTAGSQGNAQSQSPSSSQSVSSATERSIKKQRINDDNDQKKIIQQENRIRMIHEL